MQLEPSIPPLNLYKGNGQLSVAVPIPGSHPDHVRVTMSRDRCGFRPSASIRRRLSTTTVATGRSGPGWWTLPFPSRWTRRPPETLNLGVLVVMARISDDGEGERELAVE